MGQAMGSKKGSGQPGLLSIPLPQLSGTAGLGPVLGFDDHGSFTLELHLFFSFSMNDLFSSL